MATRPAGLETLDRLNFYIDLDRYPVHEPDSGAGQALIRETHEMIADDTLVLLPNMLRQEAVSWLSAEIDDYETTAHRVDYHSTPYAWKDNSGFAPDHPRSALPRRRCSVVTTDQLDPASACVELFMFDELTEFVRQMLQFETLYRSICPTLAIQINVMREDDCFGWHFDTNDGVVSFTIQNADSGGGFEYAHLIRDEHDENYPAIASLLAGDDSQRKPHAEPGTLSLFFGRRSMHRVAPVGPTARARQSLLYSYDRRPDMVFPKRSCERISSSDPSPYLGAGPLKPA